MCLSSPKPPAPLPPPPPPPPAPTRVDPEVKRAKGRNKRQAALAAGRGSTIVTSAQGLDSESSGGKTLLGA